MALFSPTPPKPTPARPASAAPPAPAPPRRRAEGGSPSMIGPDLTITGDLETEGTVKIEGHVRGATRGGDQVLVAAGAIIEGDVVTREAVIGGVVKGSIEASERVELLATAVVTGNILTSRLLIQEGGRINGEIQMRDGSHQAEEVRSPSHEAAKPAPPQAERRESDQESLRVV